MTATDRDSFPSWIRRRIICGMALTVVVSYCLREKNTPTCARPSADGVCCLSIGWLRARAGQFAEMHGLEWSNPWPRGFI